MSNQGLLEEVLVQSKLQEGLGSKSCASDENKAKTNTTSEEDEEKDLDDDSDDDDLVDENVDIDEDLTDHGLDPNAKEANNSTMTEVRMPINGNISPLEFAAGVREPEPLSTNKDKTPFILKEDKPSKSAKISTGTTSKDET